MARIDEHGRPEPPLAAGEVDTLVGYLDYQRATLAWKCSGLDAAGLCATTAASTMTLGGLLKHMSYVEDHWFSRFLHDLPAREPWASVDWRSDRDWDWSSACDDSPSELRTTWEAAVERSRELVALALESGGLDQLSARAWPNGARPSLRWILCHMVEEYARHNGHADLLREAYDGAASGE
jgi:uncharacterized damage-inducible protein DinB